MNFGKKIILISSLLFPTMVYGGESADSLVSIVKSINSGGNITVIQSEALGKLVERRITAETEKSDVAEAVEENIHHGTPATRSGYRIQVFDDNNPRTARRQAEARHSQMASAFPQYHSYITFNSPYWRVKVGDFRTRGEAEAAMAEIRDAFPTLGAYLRIVRDKINIVD